MDEDRIPLALDAFAGKNAPVGCALLMLGWQVELLEWETNSADDIRRPAKQREFSRYARDADATILAVPCGSLARAREKPTPGQGAAQECSAWETHQAAAGG